MLIAAAAIALQVSVPLQPVLSFGSSQEISKAVQKIAQLTASKDYKGATTALKLIPGQQTTIGWDDEGVPKGARFDYAKARDTAMSEWASGIGVTQLKVSKTAPNVAVTLSGEGGMTLAWSDDPAKPRLTVTIGATKNGAPIDPATVQNDVSYALGMYFGVSRLPLPGLLMSGVENATQLMHLNGLEVSIAKSNVITCERIAEWVSKSAPVLTGTPTLEGDLAPVKAGPILQGTHVPVSFDIKNSGTAPLAFRIIPDCSCFSTYRNDLVAAQQPAKAMASMDTTNFAGTVKGGVIHHNLYFFSNDPANPVKVIPVDVTITPRYRVLPDRQISIADENGQLTYEAYLFTPADHPLTVTSADSQGWPGTVTFEPWTGTMADPDLNEGPLPRKGYKFTLKLKDIPEGMQLGTNIAIATDDSTFPQIMVEVIAQRGIIALPPALFMSEVGAAPRKMSFLVARPGKAFKIVSVDADSDHLKTTFEPTQTVGEYRVTVTYDGAAPKGDYHATITIATDDSRQKTILVPVTGTVR